VANGITTETLFRMLLAGLEGVRRECETPIADMPRLESWHAPEWAAFCAAQTSRMRSWRAADEALRAWEEQTGTRFDGTSLVPVEVSPRLRVVK